MGFLVLALVTGAAIVGLVRRSWRRRQAERLREQARIQVIESQMAGLRAALRISMAEHNTRKRMHQVHDRDVFANSTLHEEPEQWR